jgi:hypothetical protein
LPGATDLLSLKEIPRGVPGSAVAATRPRGSLMTRRFVRGSFVLPLLLIGLPVHAGFLPDWDLSIAWIDDYGSGAPASIMVRPDGAGDLLTQARLPDGTQVSAGITVMLIDPAGFPVPNFPWEDIWLEAIDDGAKFCLGGSSPLHDTDANGQTRFERSPRGGGWTDAGLQVMILATPLTGPPLPIHVNSPDIDGNGWVDISDLVVFSGDYYGTYAYRSDFLRDGVINLSDVARLGSALGRQCP